MNLDVNNLYGWAMSQKLPVGGFKQKKNLLKFNEDFIKNYDEDSDKGCIFEVDVEYPKNLHNLHSDLKVMKRADSCKHRQVDKNIKCEKKLFKSHLHSSKLVKRVQKHATSTNQKMAASMESLLVRLLL